MCLIELRDRVLMLTALEKRMQFMQSEILKAKDEVASQLRNYERESKDVERLQKDSFSTFLFKLVGKYEDKLEKEQRDEINAKINYDRAVTHLEQLENERRELGTRITNLRLEAKIFETELDSRRQQLAGKLSEPTGIHFAWLEDQRNDIISQITVIEEAQRVAARAKSTAKKVAKSLESAESWATFDVFGGRGVITNMAKYSHIDDAEEQFNILSHDLRELRDEINDVQGLTEISSGQRAVDFWFDNIFTSLSVRQKIVDNAGQIENLITGIKRAEYALKEKLSEKEKELAKNRQQEEELLLSI